MPDHVVKELLEAAMKRAFGGQPATYGILVVANVEMLNEIPKFHPYAQMLKDAKVAILVCGTENTQGILGRTVQQLRLF